MWNRDSPVSDVSLQYQYSSGIPCSFSPGIPRNSTKVKTNAGKIPTSAESRNRLPYLVLDSLFCLFFTFRDMAQFKAAEISDVFHDSASPERGILRTTLFFFCDVDSDGGKSRGVMIFAIYP